LGIDEQLDAIKLDSTLVAINARLLDGLEVGAVHGDYVAEALEILGTQRSRPAS